MIGNSKFLIDIKRGGSEVVTFGDGAQGNVIGKGTLNVPGIPNLKNVMLVDGLKKNLISISQLCDEGLLVKFIKEECCVSDCNHEIFMIGKRSSDNCYLLKNEETCFKTTI